MEQSVGHFHDVVFGEARHLLATMLHRVFKGVADNSLAARSRDDFEALHHVFAQAVLHARVAVLFVLTYDDDVHAGMPGLDEGMVSNAGPNVRVEPESLTRSDVKALEAAALRRGDGGFEKNFGASQGFPRARLDTRGIAAQVNLFANFYDFGFEPRAGGRKYLQRCRHDFRADSVAVGDGDFCSSGHSWLGEV